MPTVPLYHLVYTNVGADYRFINLPPGWANLARRERLERWVQQLTIPDQYNRFPGYAYSCFRLGPLPYVCLATTFANFGRDRYNEAGVLTHVLLAPTDPNTDKDAVKGLLYIAALVEKILGFDIIDRNTPLNDYIRYYTQDHSVEVMPPSLGLLSGLDPDLLLEVLKVAYLTRERSIDYTLAVPDTAALLRTLAIGSAVLPPRLRLHFYWGCGVMQNLRRQANIAIGQVHMQNANEQISNIVPYYRDKIYECVNNGDPKQWLETIWTQWDYRSWEDFLDDVLKAK